MTIAGRIWIEHVQIERNACEGDREEGATVDTAGKEPSSHRGPELIPREFLKVIAVWSLVPGYLLAGGFMGYAADTWLHTFPFLTGAGLILALVLAVRDMLRLRHMF